MPLEMPVPIASGKCLSSEKKAIVCLSVNYKSD